MLVSMKIDAYMDSYIPVVIQVDAYLRVASDFDVYLSIPTWIVRCLHTDCYIV